MKEKSKKMLLMVTIISILFSTLATIFSGKTSAKVTNYSETITNASDWIVEYATSSSGNITDWIKSNGFDITSIKNQDVLNFEKATDVYKKFSDNLFDVPDTVALLNWRSALYESVKINGENDNVYNDLISSFKQMGINTEKLKLTATIFADGKKYELDSNKREYTEEQLVEMFEGDIIDGKTTITFSNDGVTSTIDGVTVENIKTITVENDTITIVDKNNKSVTTKKGFYLNNGSQDTENIKITKDGKDIDLFQDSKVKKNFFGIKFFENINKWVIYYGEGDGMVCDKVNFRVVDGDNNTWVLVLGQDQNCYLVNNKVFNDEFDTTLEYIAKIDEKEVGGTVENEVYKPNYDKDNIKRDADVTAIIKSTNGDNIVTVNGKALDSTGKTNEDGWYYPNVNDKTTIAKLYPFSKYDNSTDNGMVTEKVELENEEGLKSNQTVSIKWPFRIIDKTYDPKDITQDTKTVTVTITTNLPMDPSKIPDGWTIVPDTDNHKITKTYNRGDNVNEDVTVYQNKTGDTANTDVTINWSGNKPSVLPQTGESIKVLALIVLCLGIAIVFVKKVKNNKF
jgi:hypothetical protein